MLSINDDIHFNLCNTCWGAPVIKRALDQQNLRRAAQQKANETGKAQGIFEENGQERSGDYDTLVSAGRTVTEILY